MSQNRVDVVIIGAGPAGLSAAIWCRDLGLNSIVLEAESEPGGQLLQIHQPVTNYIGLECRNGRDLRDRFLRSLSLQSPIDLRLDAKATELDAARRVVALQDGSEITATAVVLATGVRRRTLRVAGEEQFAKKGIIASGVRERPAAEGKMVVVVGGGDAAAENALILSEVAEHVFLVHRGSRLGARAEFADAIAKNSKVTFLPETIVTHFSGGESLHRVHCRKLGRSEDFVLDAEIALIRIGVTPNNELFAGQLACDAGGYILIDSGQQTSATGIFAAGDVAAPASLTIATATGTAASAAKAIQRLTQP